MPSSSRPASLIGRSGTPRPPRCARRYWKLAWRWTRRRPGVPRHAPDWTGAKESPPDKDHRRVIVLSESGGLGGFAALDYGESGGPITPGGPGWQVATEARL